MSYIYGVLGLATTIYAVILERLKRHLEPDWTWVEVVIGTGLVLSFAHWQRRSTPELSAGEFEKVVWFSFAIGGIPIIVWQFWQRISDLQEAVAEVKANGR